MDHDLCGFSFQAGFLDSEDCWLVSLVLLEVDKLADISSFQYEVDMREVV